MCATLGGFERRGQNDPAAQDSPAAGRGQGMRRGDTPKGVAPESVEVYLRRLGEQPDNVIDVGAAALALAKLDRPGLDLAGYRDHLAALARETADSAATGDGLAGRIDAVNRALFAVHGYVGDAETYDDIQNADLTRVIDRRKGLPVALGILYIHAARAQGWEAFGIGFPGHFLIRLDEGGGRALIDPFHGGRRCEAADLRALLKATHGSAVELEPAYYAAISDRAVLLRLENNIKLRRLQSGDETGALAIVERCLWFAPGEATLWREAGALQARHGNLRAAIDAFERFIDLTPGEEERRQAATLISQLRGKLN